MKDFWWGRYSIVFYAGVFALLALLGGLLGLWSAWWFVPLAALLGLGIHDRLQQKHTLLGNYPLLGRFRFFFETIRPELRQYFWEADDDELPYSRNQRAMVYQRAKGIMAARPFGSTQAMYQDEFSWLNHAIQPTHIVDKHFRVVVGEGDAAYAASVLNISGTSFGSLSPRAIQALNTGAGWGDFAHNTGEGSYSKYHQAGGGDVIWQISTGYFGCRTPEGRFDPDAFAEKAVSPLVKMIEIKISQGAKPGHGGMLLGPKVTAEIAATRGIPEGQDCVSPAHHAEFSTPTELLDFADRLRRLSGGKPVGIKLCIGHPWEFLAIVKAMVESQRYLDFITVDGAEGGTGAAPVEFTDHLGTPLKDGLTFVDNALRAVGLRERIKVAASGKIVSAFDIAQHCALGADWVNMARPFMFALGCIQARDCSSGRCPTGIATMDPKRYRVIDVDDRAMRVRNFHQNTLNALAELMESAGLEHPSQLNRQHIMRRHSGSQVQMEEKFSPTVRNKALLTEGACGDERIDAYWRRVSGECFGLMPEAVEA